MKLITLALANSKTFLPIIIAPFNWEDVVFYKSIFKLENNLFSSKPHLQDVEPFGVMRGMQIDTSLTLYLIRNFGNYVLFYLRLQFKLLSWMHSQWVNPVVRHFQFSILRSQLYRYSRYIRFIVLGHVMHQCEMIH